MNKDLKNFRLEEVVDRQLKAYNEGDYETFAACYHDNILSYDLETSAPLPHLSGLLFFTHYHKKFSENPTLHCQVIQRIVHDNLVVDKEIVSNCQSQTHQELVVYQVSQEGLISKMWFSKETF